MKEAKKLRKILNIEKKLKRNLYSALWINSVSFILLIGKAYFSLDLPHLISWKYIINGSLTIGVIVGLFYLMVKWCEVVNLIEKLTWLHTKKNLKE